VIRLAAARAAFLLLVFGVTAAAAPEDYEGKPIRTIEFDPPQQPYSQEYLDEILPVKAGATLHLIDVRAAIERLYATGRYADVRADATLSDGGVTLRFITRNNYFIGRVTVGHVPAPPNQGVLAGTTRLSLGALYRPADSQQAVANLQEVLRNNGFFRVQIEPEYRYDPATQLVEIHFRIQPDRRAHYTTPDVIGQPQRPVQDVIKSTHWKGWLGWKAVTEARTQDGVQRVRNSYQKRDRLEARVSLDKMAWDQQTNRARPTLNVESGPKIEITTAGAKISRGKLKQLVPVFEEQSVDRDLLVEGAGNLREYLESQGYFDAKVDFLSRSTNGGGSEVIEYRIDRGERYTVAAVVIQGNHYFDTATIRERMYVRPASRLQFRHGRYSSDYLRQDAEAITSLYRSNGFRDVEVTSRVERGYRGKERDLAVDINIREGPQWLVENLDLEGPSEENREGVINLLQSQAGQPFSEVNVAIDRDNVLDYYHNRGYRSVNFSWSFKPAAAPHKVNLKYSIREGQQRFLRGFLVSGLQATDPKLVEEREELHVGDPLSRASLLDTQRRLYDLGIFSRVDMALQDPEGDERDKYVLLDLDEARKYTITTGFGAEVAKIGGCQSCLDAPAGQAGFSPRASFGVTRRNFLGIGHIISLQSRVSTLEQRAVLSYEAPQFRGNSRLNLLFSGLFDDSRDVRTFSARRREASVQIGQKLSKSTTILYGYSFRRVSVSDLKISPELLPRLSQPARIGMFVTNYIFDRRDDPTDAHRGTYATVALGWASHSFGSQADFTRFIGQHASYYPFGMGGRFVLARSLSFGWLQPLRNGTEIPLPEELFAGGASSHRGFPENQAGPRDLKTGFPLGGNALLINQLELRFPLLGSNIRGVLFEDAGNVYSDLRKMAFRVDQRNLSDFDYMVHAVGFGIRYRTPIGPIRLDLAYSINPPRFIGFKGTLDQLISCSSPTPPTTGCVPTEQQISHFQFHFSLGQAF
jgi:outer membrane protein insertion porin family